MAESIDHQDIQFQKMWSYVNPGKADLLYNPYVRNDMTTTRVLNKCWNLRYEASKVVLHIKNLFLDLGGLSKGEEKDVLSLSLIFRANSREEAKYDQSYINIQ